jgi:hypothetical protein
VAPFIVPDVAGDGHAGAADRVHRYERLVVVVVDFCEIRSSAAVSRPRGFRKRL